MSAYRTLQGVGGKQALKEELRGLGLGTETGKDCAWSLPGLDGETKGELQKEYAAWVGTWVKNPRADLEAKSIEERYLYDEHGQRLEKQSQLGSIGYSYDGMGRLLRAGNRAYAYDADGNRTEERLVEHQGGATGSGSGAERDPALDAAYSYSADNRMVGYRDSLGESWSYSYDGLGRRTAKVRTQAAHGSPHGGLVTESTSYVGLGFEVLFQSSTEEPWNRKATQSRLGFILGPGGVAYGALEGEAGGGQRFYHYEAGGNLSAVTLDKPGRSVERYEWGAFGQKHAGGWSGQAEWQGQTSALYESVGFAGQRVDLESGLYSYAYRNWDPLSGVWLEEDPIRAAEGWYSFCNQNPLEFTDPLGLKGHGKGVCDPSSVVSSYMFTTPEPKVWSIPTLRKFAYVGGGAEHTRDRGQCRHPGGE